jgi:hypothetical protein
MPLPSLVLHYLSAGFSFSGPNEIPAGFIEKNNHQSLLNLQNIAKTV